MRLLPRRPRTILLAGILSTMTVAAALAISLTSQASDGGTTSTQDTVPTQESTPAPTTPASQVSLLCQHAANAASNGQTDAFLQWVNSLCSSEGATNLANSSLAQGSDSSTPLGNLLCAYAKQEVAAGTATSLDEEQNELCSIPQTPQPTGIQTVGQQPPSQTDFTATNVWAETISDNYTLVYAGSQSAQLTNEQPGDTALSEVLVFSDPAGWKVIQTGTSDGPLTISAANGDTLTLTAPDGATFKFNATSETFNIGTSSG